MEGKMTGVWQLNNTFLFCFLKQKNKQRGTGTQTEEIRSQRVQNLISSNSEKT